MLNERVKLLTDYAEKYMEKGLQLVGPKGFWQNLSEKLSGKSQRLPVAGIGDEVPFEHLVEEGFVPFCKIDERIIHVKKNQQECWLAITEDDEVWDLSDWGEDEFFVTQFLAECYFMVTRDDFRIDEDERGVFLSIVGLLEATRREIADARVLVYWTLVENVIEDNVITEEEEATMAMIRDALEMKGEDIKDLHQKALQEYYDIVIRYSDSEPDLEKIAGIKLMADKLGVSIEEIS